VAGVIERNGLILVAQRGSGPMAGKWEFPGGKVKEGESLVDALQREIFEEFRTNIIAGELIDRIKFVVSNRKYELAALYAQHESGEYQLTEHKQLDWVKPENLTQLDLAPADILIAEKVRRKYAK